MIGCKDDYRTVRQLAEELDAFSEGTIRHYLLHREENGLTHYVRQPGKKLLISKSGFLEWVDQQRDKQRARG